MIKKKTSRTTQPVLDLYTAGPLTKEVETQNVKSPETDAVMGKASTTTKTQTNFEPDEHKQDGAFQKSAKADADHSAPGPDKGQGKSTAPESSQPITSSTLPNSYSGNPAAEEPNTAGAQQPAEITGGFSVALNLQDAGKAPSAGFKPIFEVPGGPTHSIDGDNLEDLLDYFGDTKWGPAVYDIWTGTEVTVVSYKFATQVSDLRGWMQDDIEFTNLFGQTLHNFFTFGPDQINATEEALKRWEEVSNIRFVEAEHPEHKVDITFFGFDFTEIGVNAWGQSFGVSETDGTVVKLHIDPIVWDATDAGQFAYATLVHEIGHAIGLPQPIWMMLNTFRTVNSTRLCPIFRKK